MKRLRWLSAGLILLALAGDAIWLGRDRLIRDGDEEGQVGAAELFLGDLRGGELGGFLRRAAVDDMGDYPSLYPAAAGAWWWAAGGGQPGRPAVRAINLAFLALSAAGVYAAARGAVGAGPALLGAAATLWLPLLAGLGRHFMPEGALAAAVSWAVAAACWQRRRPTPRRALLLGLALAAGLLTKQTFPLYAALPVLACLRWRPSLLAAAAGLALAAPWYAHNALEQLQYVGQSAAYRGGAGPVAHLLFYPRVLLSLALGPAWAALVALALAASARAPGGPRRLGGLAAIWLLGGLLALTAVPKKYKRLLAPLLPAAGLAIAAGAAARPRWSPLVLAGAGWTGLLSWVSTPLATPPRAVVDFEPGCLQVWLRPPDPRDPGFAAIGAAAAAAPAGPLRLIEPPEIPCAVQTTHGWGYHLGPWLRREGLDRRILIGDDAGDAALIVDFTPGAAGELHRLELLDTRYAIRRPPADRGWTAPEDSGDTPGVRRSLP